MTVIDTVARRQALEGQVALTLAVLFWSGNFVAGRALREAIDPVTLNAVRWTIATGLFLPFAGMALWRTRAALHQHWRLVAGLSLTGVIGFQIFVYKALAATPVVNAVLILATTPIVILAWAAFSARRGIPMAGVGAVILSVLGVAALLTEGDLGALASARLGVGDLWMLCAVVVWAAYTLLLRARPTEIPGTVMVLATMLPAVPLLWVGAGVAGQTDLAALTVNHWAIILYIGVFPSLLAFLCWGYGVSRLGPEASGFFINLMPVFAAGLAWVFLGETIGAAQLGGAAAILAALVLAARIAR